MFTPQITGRPLDRKLHEALMLGSRARYDPRAYIAKEDDEKSTTMTARGLTSMVIKLLKNNG